MSSRFRFLDMFSTGKEVEGVAGGGSSLEDDGALIGVEVDGVDRSSLDLNNK